MDPPRGIPRDVPLDDLLALGGFVCAGSPPSATLDVLDHAVRVCFAPDETRVRVEVRAAARGDAPLVAERAGLEAPGNTTFSIDGPDVVGRRTLVLPEPGSLHDATYELGKAVVRLAAAVAPAPVAAPESSGASESAGAAGSAPPVAVPGPTPTPAAPAVATAAPPQVSASVAPVPGTAVVAAPAAAATLDDGSYWCFVDRPTKLCAAPGSPEVVAMLMPGVWYRAHQDDGTWVHIRHPSGASGVLAHSEVTPA